MTLKTTNKFGNIDIFTFIFWGIMILCVSVLLISLTQLIINRINERNNINKITQLNYEVIPGEKIYYRVQGKYDVIWREGIYLGLAPYDNGDKGYCFPNGLYEFDGVGEIILKCAEVWSESDYLAKTKQQFTKNTELHKKIEELTAQNLELQNELNKRSTLISFPSSMMFAGEGN